MNLSLRRKNPASAGLLALALVAGCATYKPRPLTETRVKKALAPPDLSLLRVSPRILGMPVLPPSTLDWKEGLTPDGAATLAVLLNPSLRAERDRRGLARAQLLQAGILPNPQLGAGTDIPVGTNPDGTVTAYGLDLSWDVTELIARNAKVAAAKAAAAQVDLDVAWSEWQAAEAAKMAVYDLVALREQLALEHRVVSSLESNVALLQRASKSHDVTLTDLSAAQASLREAELVQAQTEGDAKQQELVLKRALGLPPGETVRLARDTAIPPPPSLPKRKGILERVQRRRLDLLALRRGYDSQEEAVRAAVLEQFPRINLGFSHASDTSAVHTIGFAVSVDLPLFDRNQGRIAIERATRKQLFDEYVARVAGARDDFAAAEAALQAIARRMAALDAALPALRHLVEVYKRAVEEKSADVLSYRQAQIDLMNKQLQRIQLRREQADETVALELASGTYLPAIAERKK